MPKAKTKFKSKSNKCLKPKENVRDKKKERAKDIMKSKRETKRDKKKKHKKAEKTKYGKKSRSKAKDLSHKSSSDALKEAGLVTPKKTKPITEETPPTVESTSTTSSMRKSFGRRLNMDKTSPKKKQRTVGTEEKVQAHRIQWTANEGCARAIRHNSQNLSNEEIKAMSYSAKLNTLLAMYSPKQLMSAYPGICTAKCINIRNVDMNAAFLNSSKARKTISQACNDVVEINSEGSSASDEDR